MRLLYLRRFAGSQILASHCKKISVSYDRLARDVAVSKIRKRIKSHSEKSRCSGLRTSRRETALSLEDARTYCLSGYTNFVNVAQSSLNIPSPL